MKNIDIAELDCVYLSYDEPNKEETWVRIKNLVPWAKRVDGIKGSDAAHKAAAAATSTTAGATATTAVPAAMPQAIPATASPTSTRPASRSSRST